ncbi:MAG: DUF5678 domain-containing protein [Anaerolineae bacterium]
MSLPPAKKVEISQVLLDLIHDDEELFQSMSPQEMAKYGGKWIATKSKQVVAVADSLGKLYRQLDAKKLRPACVSYIEDPSFVVIYALH